MLAVIGLGYVGLPLAIQFAHCGQIVLGLDVDHSKVDLLTAGQSCIHHTSMPKYGVGKVAEALNSVCKPLNGSKILLVGLAYKANVDDDRESLTVTFRSAKAAFQRNFCGAKGDYECSDLAQLLWSKRGLWK